MKNDDDQPEDRQLELPCPYCGCRPEFHLSALERFVREEEAAKVANGVLFHDMEISN